MRSALSFLFISLFSLTLFSQPFSTAKMDSLFDHLASNNLAIGSISISQNGKLIYQRSFGKDQSATTTYRIGSISKLFTAVLTYQLIEKKELSFDDSLSTWFPDLPNAGKITIAQLLGHRSGLANFTNNNTTSYDTWKDQPKTHEELLAMIKTQKPDFEPNAKADYNNSNYLILSYIIEKITGHPYKEVVTDNIIKKIGLKNTYYGDHAGFTRNEAISYKYFDNQWKQDRAVYLDNFAGAGAIISTPPDLCQFIQALFAGQLIGKISLDRMKHIVDGYGMGLFPYGDKEHTGFGHNGKTEGFASSLQYYPDSHLAIAYCTNGEVYSKTTILENVSKIAFNLPDTIPTFTPILLDTTLLDQYTGTYSAPSGLEVVSKRNGNALILDTKGQHFNAIPISEHEFWNRQYGFFFYFDKAGKQLFIEDVEDVYELNKHAQPVSLTITNPETISPTTSFSKYVSAIRYDNGDCMTSFTASQPGVDGIYVSKRANNTWTPPQRIDHGAGSENFSQLLLASNGDTWIFWQGTRQDATNIYYRTLHKDTWGPERQLKTTAMHPRAILDKLGRIWVVYEKTASSRIDLEALIFDKGHWSQSQTLTHSSFNRRASLAPAANGDIWLSWDSPVSGNYDIYLTRLSAANNTITATLPLQVTKDGGFDDSPSLTTGPDGTLWIGYNSCRSLRSEPDRTKKHSGAIFLKGYKDGKFIAAGKPFPNAMDGQVSLPDFDKSPDDAVDPYWHWKETQNYPYLFTDPKGRLWTLWRAEPTGAHNFDIFARIYDGTAWSEVFNMSVFSPGRDEWPQLLPATASSMAIFWEGQELPPPGEEARFKGGDVDSYNTRANRNVVLTGIINVPGSLCPIPAPIYPFPEETFHPDDDLETPLAVSPKLERKDPVTGKQLFFGDLHSHTVYSDGKYGWPDQLLFTSKYKLGIDVTVISDHAEMGLLQHSEFDELTAMAKVFTENDRYQDYLGFEWTGQPDFGHRILIFPGWAGQPISSALPEGNTIEKLDSLARRYHAIYSAHHTAQATWGRWNPAAAWFPKEEPNFEIASWHGRFEYYNNPHEGRRQVPGHDYQDVLKAGRRQGVLAGSDTHFLSPGEGGLTGIWADSPARSSIFSAMENRHTYATTGARIGLTFHINGSPMGSEIKTDSLLKIDVSVQGTATIDHIEIVKDEENTFALIRITQPAGKKEAVFMLYDPAHPQTGKNIHLDDASLLSFHVEEQPSRKPTAYYVRITQVDGQQAWSSPIWVN